MAALVLRAHIQGQLEQLESIIVADLEILPVVRQIKRVVAKARREQIDATPACIKGL